ncbi:MAG: recombinase family protein, partial [Longimicrobiales bacterium]
MSTALKCAQRVAIYARVSTASRTKHGDKVAYDQRPEVQEDLLRGVAERREWTVYRVYTDRISGGKESRPALDELMRDARRRQFEVVMVWRFDRFTRSTRHLVNALEEFRSLGIDFVSYEEAIDTASPLGKCMFSIVAAIAELERNLITERVRTGLAHA